MPSENPSPNFHAILNTVNPARGAGFELLVALILMNKGDPLTLSWQPVAQILKQLEAAKIMLEKGYKRHLGAHVDNLPASMMLAQSNALAALKTSFQNLLLLTKTSQMEDIPVTRFDEMAVELRQTLRPTILTFLDELQHFERALQSKAP